MEESMAKISHSNQATLALLAITASLALAADPISLLTKDRVYARNHPSAAAVLSDPTAGILEAQHPEAAALLQRWAPELNATRSRLGVSVTILDGPTYRRTFHADSLGLTLFGTDLVFLNEEQLPTEKLKAAATAHELVHVSHSHPELPLGQHSVLRHLLFSEEAEAHWTDIQMARTLHIASPTSLFWTFLVDIFNLPIAYLLFSLATFRLIQLLKIHGVRKKPSPQVFPPHVATVTSA